MNPTGNNPGPQPALKSIGVQMTVSLLCLIATLSMVWPTYRSFLNIKVNENEAWNAYYADAALGSMPLYPAPDQLITNNYPPLSFYLLGAVGRLIGDNILAGRLISLLAVLGIAFLCARTIRELGGDRRAGWVGASFLVATLCLFFDTYIGMNEPQLLALCIMAFGFLLFIKAARLNRGYALPICIMVLAGFFKHNIIALPLSALLWLVIQRRWRPFFSCLILSFFLMVLGFFACYVAYGRDFFFNFLTPRLFSLDQEWDALVEVQCVGVVLVAWFFIGIIKRRDQNVQLVNLLVLNGLLVHFLQRTGDGVDTNSLFDLVIGCGIAAGLAFSYLGKLQGSGRPRILQLGFLVALCLRLIFSENSSDVLHPFSPKFQHEIARREEIVSRLIAKIRAVPGNVESDAYLCYKAGKPFVVDEFNLSERINTGKIPKDVLSKRIHDHSLTTIEADPGIEW